MLETAGAGGKGQQREGYLSVSKNMLGWWVGSSERQEGIGEVVCVYWMMCLAVRSSDRLRPHLIALLFRTHASLPCSAVIRLLARLAAFAPERFAQDYLVKCILHLLAVLKHTGVCVRVCMCVCVLTIDLR